MEILDIIRIAVAAGAEIMKVYEAGRGSISTKQDGSFVTQADLAAERIILNGLHAVDADTPVVAEEQVAAGRVPETSDSFYLVDPLDGTLEFVNRNDDFTVNIGLIRAGVPIAGVVYAPALGQIFAGIDGVAVEAFVVKREVGPFRPITIRQAPPSLVVVGSRSHASPAELVWLERYPVERHLKRGSSLKFCLIAAGRADVYPRFGRTMEWDTAAGDAVLRAAGGMVTDLDGAPLTYNKRRGRTHSDFANPAFVAYGDPRLTHGAAGQ